MGKSEATCDCAVIHEDILEHVKACMMPASSLSSMTKLFKIFGDDTRVGILSALNCHHMCVCDLAVLLNMTKSAISHQLRVLRENNLVKFEKKGKHAYYSLADEHAKKILDVALEHINE